MDLHASQIQGFFDIPVDNLLGNPVFVDYYAKKFGEKCEDMVVVSPDVGSVARARTFAQKLHMGLAIVDKRRQKANQCEVMNVIGDVEGKDCILFDDMIDTAGSICNAAKAIVEVGGANSVYACASHGVLSGPALERLNNSVIKEVALLNTIPETMGDGCEKIKYISVAPMFAEAIERIYQEISIAKLFELNTFQKETACAIIEGLRMQSLYIYHKEARALFFNRNGGSGGVEWLLVGLGNPGTRVRIHPPQYGLAGRWTA